MIAEPGILSTSPWNSDLLLKDLQSDFFRSYVSVNDVVDMGFPTMDIDNDSWMRNGRGDTKQAFGSSCSGSSASSECSDELNLEFDGSWFSSSCAAQVFPLVDHDYLNTSFSLLDDENFISVSSSSPLPPFPSELNGDEGDCNFDWVAGEDLIVTSIGSFCTEEEQDVEDGDEDDDEGEEQESSSEDMFPSDFCMTPPKINRTRPISDAVTSNKLWSKMVLSEQLEVVDALTNIVSNQMGLREQLDIIRIIEPSAVISPTDKEFVIDLNCLNDRKLCLVRDYVRRVQSAQEARQNKSGKQSCSPNRSFSSGYSSPVAASTSFDRNVVTKVDSNSSPVRGKGSKKEPKEKRPPQKVFRQRQKKEYKQLLKERRSGLFEREEVLSLTTMPISVEEEDDDIDILG